jgi:Zn finger protein HypA/HybF involved in hydrogenase expression
VRVSPKAFFIGKSMSNNYFELLKSPLWQKKRLENLKLADWECTNCGSKDDQLQVHHKQYIKGKNPWEYEDEQLQVLCNKCHGEMHQILDAIKTIISYSDIYEIYNLLRGFGSDNVNSKYDLSISNADNYDIFNVGVIASIIKFVHPKHYKYIAENIINLSNNTDVVTDLYRARFNFDGVDYE